MGSHRDFPRATGINEQRASVPMEACISDIGRERSVKERREKK
jgi:hypothetical protein